MLLACGQAGLAASATNPLRLRELGLITYPSPLLEGLLEQPDVLAAEVLARLEPTDLVLFGQAGRACRAAMVAFGVPQEAERWSEDSDDEGTGGGLLLLRVEDFVGFVELLAWAKARGCPWDESICVHAAEGGHVEVLKWAWERRCPWDSRVCSSAAWGGHLEVLQWARKQGCEWNGLTCRYAAEEGAPGSAQVGARAWVPVERIHLFVRRIRRALARAAMGASERLPLGLGDVQLRAGTYRC